MRKLYFKKYESSAALFHRRHLRSVYWRSRCDSTTAILEAIWISDRSNRRIIGELSASEARELYGVSSKVRSIQLYHQDADHGLIRLRIGQKPTNDGLQRSMNVKGNR